MRGKPSDNLDDLPPVTLPAPDSRWCQHWASVLSNLPSVCASLSDLELITTNFKDDTFKCLHCFH